jgi:hypothetical protein
MVTAPGNPILGQAAPLSRRHLPVLAGPSTHQLNYAVPVQLEW